MTFSRWSTSVIKHATLFYLFTDRHDRVFLTHHGFNTEFQEYRNECGEENLQTVKERENSCVEVGQWT